MTEPMSSLPDVPEPLRGSILLALPDRRVWVRGPFGWDSNKGWFGWSWELVLREYGAAHLRVGVFAHPLGGAGSVRLDERDHLFQKDWLDLCKVCQKGIEEPHTPWPFACCDHCGCTDDRTGHDDTCVCGLQ